MKKCLQCERIYDDETNFCLSDGTTLVPGSFASSHDETPTVYRNAPPAPTVSSSAPIIAPISPAAPQTRHTLLIAAVVAFFALIAGGAIVGIVIYGLNSSDKKEANVADVSNSGEKTNRNTSAQQKPGNDNLAQNLKRQQDKLDQERRKLEDERKALEAKKKEAAATPQPSDARTAVIVDPPSNIRAAPNGAVLCVARTRGTVVNILGSTGVSDNNGTWYYTDYCGRQGVIHSTQIKF